MSGILTGREVEDLAMQVAKTAGPTANRNDEYHRHVISWMKVRGGAEVGTWTAWCRGWDKARQGS